MPARFIRKAPNPSRIVYASLAGDLVLLTFCFFARCDDFGVAALYYYIFVSSRAATNFGVAPVALLHFCFFARRDEFLSGFLQLTEDGYAGAIHSQNRSDRKSAVRGDLVAMGFGDFLNQAVGAQESKLAADRR
jgi:hypothetical protein